MKGALCALLFLGVVGTGSTLAINCYSCTGSSTSNNNCADPFNSTGINKTSCSGQCLKSFTKSEGKTLTVVRQCAPLCVELCATVFSVEGCTKCCDFELCNGAGPVTFSLVAMFAMVASTWAFSQQ